MHYKAMNSKHCVCFSQSDMDEIKSFMEKNKSVQEHPQEDRQSWEKQSFTKPLQENRGLPEMIILFHRNDFSILTVCFKEFSRADWIRIFFPAVVLVFQTR